jgi:iron complex outermembrane receptor protein
MAAHAQPVSPQEEEQALAQLYGSEEMVSIATGGQQDLRRAPAVATVITAEQIRAMGATDLDEVMETVPGVHVTRSDNHYFAAYDFRGINGNPTNPQVLVLQNGIPINSMYRGDRGESARGQPLENIARIEIIRGPGSALYGADAFAGVINIITKQAQDTPGTELGVRGGSFNTQSAWLLHGGTMGNMDVAAYLRVGGTDGQKEIVRADAATRLDQIFGTHASLAPGPLNTGHDDVDASLDLGYGAWRLRGGYKLRDDLGTGAGVSYALDPVGKEKGERVTADVSWSDPRFTQNWGLGFIGSYFQFNEDHTTFNLYPPGTSFPTGVFPRGMIGSPGRWERQVRASGYATYTGFAGHNLRFGLGHENLDLYKVRTRKNFLLNAAGLPVPNPASGELIDYSAIQPHLLPHRRLNDYCYLQDEWHFTRDWALTAGLRHDSFSDFGATTNPRLALVWDASLDLTAKLLYGQAFRAPSVNEQYSINPVANGNPNLEPESIRTLEAAFSWQARKDTLVNLSLFHYDMGDTIRPVPNAVAGTGATYANTGEQYGRGAELEVVWEASRSVRLTGSYSHQKTMDKATDADSGYAPHHHLYARADWRFVDNWLLSPQVNWVADRKRAFGDTRPDVPDSTSVDLTLHSERGKGKWSFAASVRNLANATILEPTLYAAPIAGHPEIPTSMIPNDMPLAGRSLYAEIRFAF